MALSVSSSSSISASGFSRSSQELKGSGSFYLFLAFFVKFFYGVLFFVDFKKWV